MDSFVGARKSFTAAIWFAVIGAILVALGFVLSSSRFIEQNALASLSYIIAALFGILAFISSCLAVHQWFSGCHETLDTLKDIRDTLKGKGGN